MENISCARLAKMVRERMNQKAYRIAHGLSLADFAKRIGVHAVSCWRYENGRVPEARTMRRIIEEFGGEITADDYFRGYAPKRPSTSWATMPGTIAEEDTNV
jgi:transcriptional regulator with XRE-family HTH domain